jgi:hypothetical protein
MYPTLISMTYDNRATLGAVRRTLARIGARGLTRSPSQ